METFHKEQKYFDLVICTQSNDPIYRIWPAEKEKIKKARTDQPASGAERRDAGCKNPGC